MISNLKGEYWWIPLTTTTTSRTTGVVTSTVETTELYLILEDFGRTVLINNGIGDTIQVNKTSLIKKWEPNRFQRFLGYK